MGIAPVMAPGDRGQDEIARAADPPAGVAVWTLALACAGLAAGLFAGTTDPTAPSGSRWLLLGLALVVAGRLTVEIRHRGEVDAFDVFETALTPALFFLPAPGVVLLVALAKSVAQIWLGMPWPKLAFNVAQWTACAGCGALTFALLAAGRPTEDRLPALVTSMAVVAVVNVVALSHPAQLLVVVALPLLLHRVGQGYGLAHADLDRMRRMQNATRVLS